METNYELMSLLYFPSQVDQEIKSVSPKEKQIKSGVINQFDS